MIFPSGNAPWTWSLIDWSNRKAKLSKVTFPLPNAYVDLTLRVERHLRSFVQGTRENRFKEIKFRQVLKIFSKENAARRALRGIYRTTRLCSGNNEASFVFPKGKKIASKISSGFVRITSFILILENDIKISIDFGLRRILKSIKFFQRYRDELILWLRMNKNNIKLSKSKSCIFLDNYMRLATMTENH